MKRKKAKCLTPGCKNKAHARGICLPCYSSHYDAIKAGETTWRKLETAGLALVRFSSSATAAREILGRIVTTKKTGKPNAILTDAKRAKTAAAKSPAGGKHANDC